MDRRFIWAMALMTLIVMAPAVLTHEQRRERVKTLLKSKSAPAPVITVADTPYYSETAIAEFLAPPA